MIDHPFKIFAPYQDQLRIVLFSREEVDDETAMKELGAKKSAGLHQVHGNTTVIIHDATHRDVQADGMITSEKNIALCVRWADCQNFVVLDPHKKILGTLHAGWRGLNAGAIPELFTMMKQKFNVDPSDVLVGAGPSLCLSCASFSNPEEELPNIHPSFFSNNCVDLQGVAHKQLRVAGVQESHIERHLDCTRCLPEKYWTYRGGDKKAVINGFSNMLACCLK